MFEKIKYETVNISLPINTAIASEKISIPDGKVVAMATTPIVNIENRIINLSVLDNGNEVIKPADVRFSEKTSGGTFKESMRPVTFDGGRSFEVKLVANTTSATEAITVQVMFLIEQTSY